MIGRIGAQHAEIGLAVAAPLLAIIFALLVTSVVLLAAGNNPIEPGVVNVNKCVSDVISAASRLLPAHIRLTVRTDRNDLTAEIDLVEEFARVYGLDNIPAPQPRAFVDVGDDRRSRAIADLRGQRAGLRHQVLGRHHTVDETPGRRLLGADQIERISAAMGFVKSRAKTIVELVDQTEFLTATRPLTLDAKAAAQLTDETRERLSRLSAILAGTATWAEPELEALLKKFAESEGVGFGKFGPSLRAILTGGSQAPDLNKIMAALGREESLGRLDDALAERA